MDFDVFERCALGQARLAFSSDSSAKKISTVDVDEQTRNQAVSSSWLFNNYSRRSLFHYLPGYSTTSASQKFIACQVCRCCGRQSKSICTQPRPEATSLWIRFVLMFLTRALQSREVRINVHNISATKRPKSRVYRCYDMTGRCVLYVMYAHGFIDWVTLSAT